MQHKSLEETIMDLHKKYKNKPSPLSLMNPNVAMAPQQQGTPPTHDIRSALLGSFKPRQDILR